MSPRLWREGGLFGCEKCVFLLFPLYSDYQLTQPHVQQQSVGHEVAILRLGLSSSSPSPIPRLIASFLSPTSFHIILEHAAGGDLWTVLERQNEGVEPGSEVGLREDWVRFWMAQLVEAVEWLHEKGWAHR